MQIGISQLILPDLPLADFFRTAKSAGYEVVEIMMRPQGELTPTTPEPQLKDIAKKAADAGVKLVSMCHSHTTGNLLRAGENQATSIDQTRAGLRAAAVMGITCTLHTLGRLSPDLYYDDAYRTGVDSMRQLSTTCRETGVDLAIEFVWNGFLFSPMEMARFIDDAHSPHIGFYMDPGNMAVFQFPHHWARILGRRIKRVHMKDWQGNALNGSWPALLEGKVDFPALNRELRNAGYDGPMISEVPPNVASLEKTAEAIRKIISM